MSQRLVLKASETVTLGEMEDFVKRAKEYGMTSRTEVYLLFTGDGENPLSSRFTVDLPEGVKVVSGRSIRIKQQTDKQVAVVDQIAKHKEEKEAGKEEGYVPPVGRTTPPPVRKGKCSVCNFNKIMNSKGIIKKHNSQGKMCPGSGVRRATPPLKKKKVAKK